MASKLAARGPGHWHRPCWRACSSPGPVPQARGLSMEQRARCAAWAARQRPLWPFPSAAPRPGRPGAPRASPLIVAVFTVIDNQPGRRRVCARARARWAESPWHSSVLLSHAPRSRGVKPNLAVRSPLEKLPPKPGPARATQSRPPAQGQLWRSSHTVRATARTGITRGATVITAARSPARRSNGRWNQASAE